MNDQGGAVPLKPKVKPHRLMFTLAIAGMLAGTLIVSVFHATEPTIRAYKARMIRLAVQEVLHEPESYDTLYVIDGELRLALPADRSPDDFEHVYRGYRDRGVVGYAVVAGAPGFQDVIRLIFGYDLDRSELLGMRVLENKETPGLGDKIVKDEEFVNQFEGVATPLEGVKSEGASPNEIVMITGATISSRAVIRIINDALERLEPLIVEYEEGL